MAIVYREDDIPVSPSGIMVGTPDCPICFRRLQYNPMPDIGETHWYCPSCSWWDTQELIYYLMKDEDA